MRRFSHTLVAASLDLVACADAHSPTTTSKLEISVAPLNLPGLAKVCYDLRTTNAADGVGATVWSAGDPRVDGPTDTNSLCSTRYGTGPGGDITFVGSCDASPASPGDTSRVNSVTLWVDSLFETGGAIIPEDGPDGWQDPCPAGCTLNANCQENSDTRVEFNLTILRQANQGFFDIGINFDDIFCSAKVDCVDSAGVPLKLLFNPTTGLRDTTIVSAFACTAGVGASTVLYRDPLEITCGNKVTRLPPGAGKGNAWPTPSSDPDVTDAIWQYAVYADEEALDCAGVSCSKRYWNVAFGLDANVDDCVLSTAMTASDGPLGGFATPAATTYPYVTVTVPLTDEDGLICGKHALNGGSGVGTDYTGVTISEVFEASFDGLSFSDRVPACTPACMNGGTCGTAGVCDCPDAWTGTDCGTSACATAPCLNGGLCIGANDCACPAGWDGATCGIAVCGAGCLNGGNCTAPGVCTCVNGYTGPSCEVSPISGNADNIVTSGLLLDYNAASSASYPGSGSTLTNAAGNFLHGTLVNGATYSTLHAGALTFNRTNQYVEIPNNAALKFNNSEMTIDTWFRTSVDDNAYQAIFTTSDTSWQSVIQLAKARNGVAGFNTGAVYFQIIAGGVPYRVVSTLTGAELASSGVIHYTGVLKRETGNTWTVKLFRNGVLDVQTTVTMSYDFSAMNMTSRVGSSNPSYPELFGGQIHNLRVYNRALSDAEVMQNHNTQKARFETVSAFSVRKLVPSYAGPALRVRRGSDNAEADIGFTSAGDLDTGALQTFLGSASGFVKTWYDQNSFFHAQQTNASLQPIIANAGVIVTAGTRTSLDFSSGRHLSRANVEGMDVKNHTFVAVTRTAATRTSSQAFLGSGQGATSGIRWALGDGTSTTEGLGWGGASGSTGLGAGPVEGLKRYLSFYRKTPTGWDIALNNAVISSIADTSKPTGLFQLHLGCESPTGASTYAFNGHMQEMMIFAADKGEDRHALQEDVNGYFAAYAMPVVSDPDAQTFINRAGIKDTLRAVAVNDLVIDLKGFGLWSKMKAIYPMVGATAESHKWNLKDPRDTDDAFRLRFFGTWTHSALGAKPDGSSGYATTYLNAANVLTAHDTHLSFYSNTNSAGQNGGWGKTDIGCQESGALGATAHLNLSARTYSDRFMTTGYDNANSLTPATTITDSRGFAVASKTSTSSLKGWLNNTLMGAIAAGGTLPAHPVLLGRNGNATSSYEWSDRACAFASIGSGLSDADVANFYVAVQRFETMLGRQFGTPSYGTSVSGANLTASSLVSHIDTANTASYAGSGSTVTDLVAGSPTNTLTLYNSVGYDSATGSLTFDGGTKHGASPTVFNATSGTWSLWFNAATLNNNTSGAQRLLYQSNGGFNEINIIIGSGTLQFRGYDASRYVWTITTTALSANKWHHVAGTYDGSIARLYIDGLFVGASPQLGPVGNATLFSVGGVRWPSGFVSGYSLNGKIANYQIYARSLSEGEIVQNFNATRARFQR